VLELGRRGVGLAALTHAAGLSATGDPRLDEALPLAERYELPVATVAAVAEAPRVIAVGTTVARALEGCAAAHGGRLVPGPGETDLLLDERHVLRVADGILTGVHEPGTSHHRLLGAFASAAILGRAAEEAERSGYLSHEFGDATLILPGPGQTRKLRTSSTPETRSVA
jgi:S-adenosylmethionine:tRNA ribosyltransferase-isomerase